MDWEFWTKELDEEVLVENGEFGTQEDFVGGLCLCPPLLDVICTLISHGSFKRS